MHAISTRMFGTLIAASLIFAGQAQLLNAQTPAATAPAPTAAGDKADITKPGTYQSGPWEYRLKITGAGTKSQGTVGELLYAGKAVEDPGVTFDYYQTPWGAIHWVGDAVLPWGAHGWMARPADAQGGRLLADPIQTGGPVVMVMVLTDGGTEAPAKMDDWVQQEMQKLGANKFKVERMWFPLNDQAVTVHDTKMYGTLATRLLPARQADSLRVLFDGTEAGVVELPRKDGTTKLVRRTLKSAMGETNFYLALRVERAAVAWPKPLDMGPESDGKEVLVKGAREVVIGLPGDKNSGCVWTIKSVQGDALKGGAVKAVGTAQFTPAAGAPRTGVFENTLRVLEKGKAVVELEYRRPWQTDGAAEKTFKVTLDVQDVPSALKTP